MWVVLNLLNGNLGCGFSNCGFELVEGDMTLTVTAEMEYLTLQFACCGLVY